MRDWLFAHGIISIVVAVIMVALSPFSMGGVVPLVFGTYLLYDSFLIFYAGREGADSVRQGSIPLEVEGGLAAVFGFLSWLQPLLQTLSASRLIGLWYVISGGLFLFSSRMARSRLRRPSAQLLTSVVSIAFGIYLIARPPGGTALNLALSGFLAVYGALILVAAGGAEKKTKMAFPNR